MELPAAGGFVDGSDHKHDGAALLPRIERVATIHVGLAAWGMIGTCASCLMAAAVFCVMWVYGTIRSEDLTDQNRKLSESIFEARRERDEEKERRHKAEVETADAKARVAEYRWTMTAVKCGK